ncbi:Laminin-type epidermal growth factor-like domai [Mactra antiquata]
MAVCGDRRRFVNIFMDIKPFLGNMKLAGLLILFVQLPHVIFAAENTCYDDFGKAKKCVPEFVNAAFNLSVDATNTCGLTGAQEYCLQTGVTGVRKSCGHFCDAGSPYLTHPPSFMTDFNSQNNWTWWQSETIYERWGEWLNSRQQHVNLTLSLGKSFDVTYIRLRFHSPRPESFAIYKRTSEDGDWIPYQYYSASCGSTYNLPYGGYVTRDNQDVATCSDEYSDISPLTGGEVPFSTLEGRPDAENFENSKTLQDWVTATDIRIVLTRMNTFGDEIFGDPRVLRSYFYAIDDLAVGARCKCNGHASSCEIAPNRELICECQHNTTGPDCNICKPFYNDRPWARATEEDAMECLPCNCNGMSNECYFDEDLYRETGHGGHCINCQDNRGGINCQECLPNHYVEARTDRCTPCSCDPTGSEELQCDDSGQCKCKPGVTGQRCDRCEDNYYDFGILGCRPCGCIAAGSLDNEPRCDSDTGSCMCKEFVEGQNCDRCKPGYFGLDVENPYGCISCFCYGHSSICTNATGYTPRSIHTDFETGKQGWTGSDRSNNAVETQYNGILQNLGISAPDNNDMVYFNAPARYLGDQRFSYNQYLTYSLRIGEENEQISPSIIDIIIEGSGQKISAPFYSQGNPTPGLEAAEYKFRLNEHSSYRWYPQLKPEPFIAILSNITAIKVRATYNPNGVGFIDDIKLDTARRGFGGEDEASWVESCTCPDGYVGQFCESCAPGYKRDPPNSGSFASCVPCECNGHSDQCDPDSGRCICNDNTVGTYCERCAVGYYGDARDGTPDDCKPCPCPGQGPCVQLHGGEIVCTACDVGYGGNLCDICLDGYYGDPKGWYGADRPCEKCECNGNIDPNAIGNCNRTTGECRKCIYNTAGFSCEKCLPNYYGDALDEEKGDCQACNCYPAGTVSAGVLNCNPTTGDCPCLPNVRGRQCDECLDGFWNLDSGQGCEACMCDPVGSLNDTCNLYTGQCECKPGVTGRMCDQCQRFYYGFSEIGCSACNCDPEGSLDMQCDTYGNCPCVAGVEGKRCDRCMENKYNITAGCIDCPPCYSLVQERVNIHRGKLRELNNLILNIGSDPTAFNDTQFLSQLTLVNDSVNVLLNDAQGAGSDNGTMGEQLQMLKEQIMDVLKRCGDITKNIMMAGTTAENSMDDIMKAEEAITRAETALKAAENYIDTEGQAALQRAKDALKNFGQQSAQMTDIAQQSKALSMRQMEEAQRIDMLSKKALETSKEALKLAMETLQMPGSIMLDIQELQAKTDDASRKYNQTKFFAEKALNMSMQAYDEALDLYSQATSLQIPAINVDLLIAESNRIKEEAAVIKQNAVDLLTKNEDLLSDVAEQRQTAEDLLESGIQHQQRADGLLADVDSARAIAKNAVDMGERTLSEANETLQTLQGFNQDVEDHRGKANEALQKVPEIEGLIKDAEARTQEAQDALSGAENDAQEALRIAEQAEDMAQGASNEASRIRQEAGRTKQRAEDLKDNADVLAEDVNDSEEQINNLNVQADNDKDLADNALQIAGQAKQTAQAASNKVADALAKVENISGILDTLRDLDTDELDRLEIELAAAEQTLIDADLESQFTKLTLANNQVKMFVQEYRQDLSELEADVMNVKDIMESLPVGCFKNIDIETPTAQ